MAATQKTTKKKPARSTDRRNIWLLIITTLLVLGSVFMFMPPQEKINQGLDIQGGLSVVLTAKSTDGADVTNDDMEKSRAIIESRVNALGASEAVVQVQGTDQILVQIPGLTNTEDALNTIGKTGKLEFARLDSFTDEDAKTKIENGQYGDEGTVSDDLGVLTLPSGETQHLKVEDGTYTPIVTGADITKVDIGKPSETSTDYAVNITLNAEGAKAFADATKELAPTKGKIVIILDNEDGDLDEDTVMMDALDCGASDFEPEEDCFTIYTEPDDCGKVASALEAKGYVFASAQVEMVPQNYVKLTDPADLKNMEKLIDMLEDSDDVQNVWHNWDND